MTTIFIKSYPGDYHWLDFCLRSIRKYVTGHAEVVVALPDTHPLPLERERVVLVKDWPARTKPGAPSPGYYHQMFVKLCADLHCPAAEHILLVDSDCVFTRPFDVSEMFHRGKPMLLRRTWAEAGEGIVWKECAEQALGMPVTHDTMAALPAIYRADTFKALRGHLRQLHGMPLDTYIRSRDRFIEFVTIGNYILQRCPQLYHAVDVAPGDIFPRPLRQAWSWGGMSDALKAELEALVASPT